MPKLNTEIDNSTTARYARRIGELEQELAACQEQRDGFCEAYRQAEQELAELKRLVREEQNTRFTTTISFSDEVRRAWEEADRKLKQAIGEE